MATPRAPALGRTPRPLTPPLQGLKWAGRPLVDCSCSLADGRRLDPIPLVWPGIPAIYGRRSGCEKCRRLLETLGHHSLGIELDADCFRLAQKAIPRLATLRPLRIGWGEGSRVRCLVLDYTGSELEMETSYGTVPDEDEKQMGLALAEHSRAD